MRGLNIPNPEKHPSRLGQEEGDGGQGRGEGEEGKGGFVGVSEALAEEEAFREFLEREGVRHPVKLSLGSPRAGVNRLVASERGMIAARGLSWWDWLGLRVRMWVLDAAFGVAWWWQRRESFTTRDIG